MSLIPFCLPKGIFFSTSVRCAKSLFCSLAGKEFACNVGDLVSIPELWRAPGERKVYALRCSGLEISMDCIVHEVTKSQTQLRISLRGPYSSSLGGENWNQMYVCVYIYIYICIRFIKIGCMPIPTPTSLNNVPYTLWSMKIVIVKLQDKLSFYFYF